jgi:hypothetical protein
MNTNYITNGYSSLRKAIDPIPNDNDARWKWIIDTEERHIINTRNGTLNPNMWYLRPYDDEKSQEEIEASVQDYLEYQATLDFEDQDVTIRSPSAG